MVVILPTSRAETTPLANPEYFLRVWVELELRVQCWRNRATHWFRFGTQDAARIAATLVAKSQK